MDLVELWKAEQLAHWQNVAAEVQKPKCPICKERGGHTLGCPTRWYAQDES